MTRKHIDAPLTPAQLAGRIGVQMRNAKYSSTEIGNFGRKGFETLIRRKLQAMLPEGTSIDDLSPAEYARRWEAAKAAHMLELGRKARENRDQRAREVLREISNVVLLTACPMCNGEHGRIVPEGVAQDLCVRHFFAAQRNAFGDVLDEAQRQRAVS